MKTGKQLFDVYNSQGPNPWKTFDGRDVPQWEHTSDQVRAKWDAVARAQRDESLDVLQFMLKFGQVPLRTDGNESFEFTTPHHITERKAIERFKFMKEELEEFYEAAQSQNLAEMADALIDLVYVAKGTAHLMNLPWDDLWDDVHRANMAKVRGVGKRGNLVDCVKPEGWVGPRTEFILEEAGYNYNNSKLARSIQWDDPEYSNGGFDVEHALKVELHNAANHIRATLESLASEAKQVASEEKYREQVALNQERSLTLSERQAIALERISSALERFERKGR